MGVRLAFLLTCSPDPDCCYSLRHYVGVFREDTLLEKLSHILSNVSSSSRYTFKPLSLEPHHKEGGVFVHFSYALDKPDDAAKREDIERVLGEIEKEVRAEATKDGGVPNWVGLGHGRVWTVKGQPWREVSMHMLGIYARTDSTNLVFLSGSRPVCIANNQSCF